MKAWGSGWPAALGGALGGALSMALVGALAWWTRAPCLAPPLGATALLCMHLPRAPTSSPRNIAGGHAIGMLCGWLALWTTGTLGQPGVLAALSLSSAVAAALALGATMLLMQACGCLHPPAGATTLVVSLGLLQDPADLAALLAGALVVAACALVLHRLRGVDYPVWSPRAGTDPSPDRDFTRP